MALSGHFGVTFTDGKTGAGAGRGGGGTAGRGGGGLSSVGISGLPEDEYHRGS